MTMPPCCARLQTHLTRAEGALAGAARKHTAAVARGRGVKQSLTDDVTAARREIASAKARITEHEAEHAGEVA